MKIFLFILLLVLLRLLSDIIEKLSGPTKSWISKDLINCNDTDQTYNPKSDNYKLGQGIEVVGCNVGNTFTSIGKTFANTVKALKNTIGLGTDIVNMA